MIEVSSLKYWDAVLRRLDRSLGYESLLGERLDAIEIKLTGGTPSSDTGRDFRTKLFVKVVGARGDFPWWQRARQLLHRSSGGLKIRAELALQVSLHARR
jgi:hypothetical protein